MPINCQHKYETKWDEAIADAKRKIEKLQSSIRVFEVRKEAGDSFPSIPLRRQRRKQQQTR